MDTIDKLISLGQTDLISFTEVLYDKLLILGGLALPNYIEYILREVVAYHVSSIELYCAVAPRIVNTIVKFYNRPLETDGMRYIISLYTSHIYENNFSPDILDAITKSLYFELSDIKGVGFARTFMRELVNYLVNMIASRKLTNNPIQVAHKIVYELPHGSYMNESDLVASCTPQMSQHLLNKLYVISKQEKDLSLGQLITVGKRDITRFISLIESLDKSPELSVHIDTITRDVLCYYARFDQKSKFVVVLDSVINIAMKLGLDYYTKMLKAFTYQDNYYPPYIARLHKVFASQYSKSELITCHISCLDSLYSNKPLSVATTLIQFTPFDDSNKYILKAKELQDSIDMKESPRKLTMSC